MPFLNFRSTRYPPCWFQQFVFLFQYFLVRLQKPKANIRLQQHRQPATSDFLAEPQKNRWLRVAGVVAGGCLLLVFVAALKNIEIKKQIAETNTGDIGLIENLGKALFNE